MSSTTSSEAAFLEDFPDIPEAGLLWPWVVASLCLLIMGIGLVWSGQRTEREVRDVPVAAHPTETGTPEVPAGVSQIRLAFVDSQNSSFAFAAEAFSREVARRSEGRLRITTLPGGMVDGTKVGELALVRMIQEGKLQMGLATSSPLSNFNPAFEVLELPFVFQDEAHADAVLDGPIGQKILAGLEPKGLKGLAYLEVGFRIFSSRVPMPTLSEFRNKKIRVMESATSILMAKALASEPVPAPVDKIYQMGKEGFIDAADRTYPTYWDFQLYDVHRYITDSRHTYSVKVLLVNQAYFDSLSPQDQKILEEVGHYIQAEQRVRQREDDHRVKEKCEAQGIQIYQLSPQERARFKEACRPLYDEYRKLRGPELLQQIQEAAGTPEAAPSPKASGAPL